MRQNLIAIVLASLLPGSGSANSRIEVVHRDDSQQFSRYVRVHDMGLPGFAIAAKTLQPALSGKLLRDFAAPVFGLSDAAKTALGDASVEEIPGGGLLYRWQQRFDGVPVWRGSLTALIDSRSQLKVLSGQPVIAAPAYQHPLTIQAANAPLRKAMTALAQRPSDRDRWQQINAQEWQHEATDANIRAQAVYLNYVNETVPGWRFEIELHAGRSSTLWEVVVSQSAELIAKTALTSDASYRYLVYADASSGRPFDSPYGDLTPLPDNFTEPTLIGASTLTVEETASNRNVPWLPANSTTLSGNQVDIYLDNSGNDGFDASDRRATISATGEFLWPLVPTMTPSGSINNQNAAMVNAFYIANWLNDYFYDAGFTAGTAEGADRLLIELQDSSDRNNADMSVPSDGQSPRMQVYLFDGATRHGVTLSGATTANLSTGYASFGPASFSTNAALAVWYDGVVGSDADPATNDTHASVFDGCETHPEPASIAGKVVLIDRGWCKFQEKVAHAEQAGAVGVIIANHLDDSLITMASLDNGPAVNIGSLFISKSDGADLRVALQNGAVTADLHRTTTMDLDGGLDSALVAHEWGHYLVGRLVNMGSSSQANGLDEGWADFVALLALSAPSDGNTDMTGRFAFSGYALNDFVHGFRRFPYSTDLNVNSLSFRHISNDIVLPDGRSGSTNSEVHNTGEIWASALWDAYAALVRNRGHDQAQSRMRRYLVQALKITPADPSFIESRDAQLDAVAALQPVESGDSDVELFRQAFARRGLGVNAHAPDKADETQAGALESFVWQATTPPVVNAGASQSVISGAAVNLSGLASDPDGTIAGLSWRQLGGVAVVLSNTTTENISFVAPDVNTAQTLSFELTATDNVQEKTSAQVSITVSPINNAVPSVSAGSDQSVTSGSTVTLSGSASDTDGSIIGYRWSQLSGSAVTLANASSATASFTAPTVNADTLLVFQLLVTDNGGNNAIDTMNVTVRSTNTPPAGGGGGGGSVNLAGIVGLAFLLGRRRRR